MGNRHKAFILKNVKKRNILDIKLLEINQGVISCIIGESGAGKSTLLRLLNMMDAPDEGEILYKGTSLQQIEPIQHRRDVMMLSQTPLIFPGSIKYNLQIGTELSGRASCSNEEMAESLKIVHLYKNLEEDAELLSGGEKQRLALARILLLNPETYLLDEPTSALDDETELNVMTSFFNVVLQRRKTVIMITHSKRLAEKFGQDIISMERLN